MNRHTSLLKSTANALKGWRHGLVGRNLQIQLIVAAAVIFVSYKLPLTPTERWIILMLIGAVLATELINSAIEELSDVLIQEHHPGIAKVKELAAGAVLLLAVIAVIIGAGIILPYLR